MIYNFLVVSKLQFPLHLVKKKLHIKFTFSIHFEEINILKIRMVETIKLNMKTEQLFYHISISQDLNFQQ